MRAAILSIGDELVCGLTVDTNAPWMAERLVKRGVMVSQIRQVGDDRGGIAEAISEMAVDIDLLFISGGLGPTPDDLTRQAMADAVSGGRLEVDAHGLRMVERWYRRASRPMPEANKRQAQRPVGATLIENQNGTAPGISTTLGQCRVNCLPGVPSEMEPMFTGLIDDLVPTTVGNATIVREVHTLGLGEAALAERLGGLLDRGREPQIGTAAKGFVVTVRIYATGSPAEAIASADKAADQVEAILGSYVFGRDIVTLPTCVGEVLRHRGLSLATVESCTGGGIVALMTEVPGSSEYMTGGWVTYSNKMKSRWVGVSEELLASHGAVSAAVARAMAEGGLHHASADICVSVTGIAGPGGGSQDKPVGTVFIGVSLQTRDGAPRTEVRRFQFFGDRAQIRRRTCLTALQMVRWRLLGIGDDDLLLAEATEELSR